MASSGDRTVPSDLMRQVNGVRDDLVKVAKELQRVAKTVGGRIERLESAAADLERKTDRAIAETQHRFQWIEHSVGAIQAQLAEAITTQDYLRARLSILDRWRNQVNGTETAILRIDGRLVDRGKTVRGADNVKEQLLPEADRLWWRDLRDQASARELRRKLHENELVSACTVLASARHDSAEHDRARHAYQQAKRAWLGVMNEHAHNADGAARAEWELQHDDEQRDRHADLLRAADQATKEIQGTARGMIAEVIGQGAEFPLWMFIFLDGSGAREGTPAWIDGAVDVLTYRAVYDFHSELNALGPWPTPDWSRTRREWYYRLAAGRFRDGDVR